MAALTPVRALMIRDLFAMGWPVRRLARIFKVPVLKVEDALRRKR